jgi:superfamily II DNA or RNA helicase
MTKSRDLREWQKTALDLWKKNDFRGIVEVATAGGKTIFAIEGAKSWLELNPLGKILVIVPTTALQDQWFVSLLDEMDLTSSDIALWPENEDLKARVHVMVVNTARTKSMIVAQNSTNLLVIADECHRYASPENANSLAINKTASLGLTATAERDYDDGLNEVLIPNLGPVIYKYSIADARNDGVVAPFSVLNVRIQFTELEDIEYKKMTSRMAQAYAKGDEDRAVILARMRASISRNAARRIPAAVAIAEENRGSRIIIFHEEIDAYILSEGLDFIVGKKYVEELKNFPDCGDLIKKISKPVLFVTAKKGGSISGKRFYEKANEPKRLVEIENADHCFNTFDTENVLISETYKWFSSLK